jgi:hypothetical protein
MKKSGKRKERKQPNVESVPVSDLKRIRRSRHYELMQKVLKELENLADHSAVKIELINLPAKTLRSAVFRAASTRNLEITSFSDQNHLYVFRKSPNSEPDASS